MPGESRCRSHLRQADRLCCHRTGEARAHILKTEGTERLQKRSASCLEGAHRATCSWRLYPGKRAPLHGVKVFNVQPESTVQGALNMQYHTLFPAITRLASCSAICTEFLLCVRTLAALI